MKTTATKHTFSVSIRVGRDFEDWEEIDKAHADFWKEASTAFSRRSYNHDQYIIDIHMNWHPLVRAYRRNYGAVPILQKGKREESRRRWQPTSRVTATISVDGKGGLYHHKDYYACYFLQTFIYEVFIMANLSCPAAANFYNLSISNQDRLNRFRSTLDSTYFDTGWTASLEGKWPKIAQLPLKKVVRWFSAFHMGHKQKADSPTERAIFVLYHLCSRGRSGVDAIIWLTHGLEALLRTRVGENISGVVRRAAMVLKADRKQQSDLNKEIRGLYDLRSAFVHGNYNIVHPLGNEVLDSRLDEESLKILDVMGFGFRLFVALLQAMIADEISEFAFEEKFVGIHFPVNK